MIRAFLDLSSGHLSPETQFRLDAQLADDVLRAPENSDAAMIGGMGSGSDDSYLIADRLMVPTRVPLCETE